MNESKTLLHLPVDRPALLTEYLPDQPYRVLQEVFPTPCHYDLLKERLLQWFNEADFDLRTVGNENSNHAALKNFYDALLRLMDALHCIYGQRGKEKKTGTPWLIVRNFCELYPQVYVRRELWCLVNAWMLHTFDNLHNLLPGVILEWYEEVVALTETGYVLTGEAA